MIMIIILIMTMIMIIILIMTMIMIIILMIIIMIMTMIMIIILMIIIMIIHSDNDDSCEGQFWGGREVPPIQFIQFIYMNIYILY